MRGSFWGGGLQVWKLQIWYVSTHAHMWYEDLVNFADVSSFVFFFAKIVLLLRGIVCGLCYRFSSSVFSFCKIKGYFWWKYKFYRLFNRYPVSGLFQIDHKLEKWQWRHNFLTWSHHQFFLKLYFFYCQV